MREGTARSIGWALAAAVVASVTTTGAGHRHAAEARSPAVVEYGGFDAATWATQIVPGPDGRMWFAERDVDSGTFRPRLGAMTLDGRLTEYPLPFEVDDLVAGPDGNLWVTGGTTRGPFTGLIADRLAKVSAVGEVLAEYPLPPMPTTGTDRLGGITAGPDGNIWYSRVGDRIGRVTPAGAITEFDVMGAPTASLGWAGDLAPGPDGNVWWVSTRGGRIGRITPAGGVTMFDVPGAGYLAAIVAGPDDNLWFSDTGVRSLGTITPQGAIDWVDADTGPVSADRLTLGPDGAVWAGAEHRLWRVAPDGRAVERPTGTRTSVSGLASGPDGRIWFTRSGDPDDGGPGPNLTSVGALALADAPIGEFTALTPARVLDTRSGNGHDGAAGPGGTFDVQVTGRGGVPATGVAAVVVNATVTGPSAGSYLTVWPAGSPRPEVSNLNWVPGQTVPNLATVAVGAGGRLSVYNAAGTADVVFDVLGYYADAGGPFGGRFLPAGPERILDTRYGTGGVPAAPVGPDATLRFRVTDRAGVPASGVTGVVMNMTATSPTTGGWLTVHPGDVPRPDASNLNFAAGTTIANLVTVRVPADGWVALHNASGHTHVIADVVGYYTTEVTTNAGRFVPLPPRRLLDTRRSYPISPGGAYDLTVAGAGGVQPDDAAAAVLNVTATQPSSGGWLAVFPHDVCWAPNVSSLNFTAGQTVPNQVVVGLSSSPHPICSEPPGTVRIRNEAGFTHVLVDVFGIFTDDDLSDYRFLAG